MKFLKICLTQCTFNEINGEIIYDYIQSNISNNDDTFSIVEFVTVNCIVSSVSFITNKFTSSIN